MVVTTLSTIMPLPTCDNHIGALVAWCSGNAFDPINKVTVRRARLLLRGVTACEQVTILVCNQPPSSTQPFFPLG